MLTCALPGCGIKVQFQHTLLLLLRAISFTARVKTHELCHRHYVGSWTPEWECGNAAEMYGTQSGTEWCRHILQSSKVFVWLSHPPSFSSAAVQPPGSTGHAESCLPKDPPPWMPLHSRSSRPCHMRLAALSATSSPAGAECATCRHQGFFQASQPPGRESSGTASGPRSLPFCRVPPGSRRLPFCRVPPDSQQPQRSQLKELVALSQQAAKHV